MSELLHTFLGILRQARAAKLLELDGPLRNAQLEGDAEYQGVRRSLAELVDTRRRLLDLPATITDGGRADLVAQWPTDFSVSALPLWFRDPDEATRLDPPGVPCVVACSEGPEATAARLAAAGHGPRDMSADDLGPAASVAGLAVL